MPDEETDQAIERVREANSAVNGAKRQENQEWAEKAEGRNPSDIEPPDRLDDDELPPEKERGKD
jgi:hypothetical protein